MVGPGTSAEESFVHYGDLVVRNKAFALEALKEKFELSTVGKQGGEQEITIPNLLDGQSEIKTQVPWKHIPALNRTMEALKNEKRMPLVISVINFQDAMNPITEKKEDKGMSLSISFDPAVGEIIEDLISKHWKLETTDAPVKVFRYTKKFKQMTEMMEAITNSFKSEEDDELILPSWLKDIAVSIWEADETVAGAIKFGNLIDNTVLPPTRYKINPAMRSKVIKEPASESEGGQARSDYFQNNLSQFKEG